MAGLVIAQDPPQMGLVPDEGAVQELAAASPPIQRPAIAFMRGIRALHSTVRIPASTRIASDPAVKSGPRSRIMNVMVYRSRTHRLALTWGFRDRLSSPVVLEEAETDAAELAAAVLA